MGSKRKFLFIAQVATGQYNGMQPDITQPTLAEAIHQSKP